MRGVVVLLLVAAGATAGCETPAVQHRYSVLVGTVVARRSEAGAGEIEIRRAHSADEGADDVELCSINEHSEIYINGRLGSLSEVEPGVRIELYGYRVPNPPETKFVVNLAYCDVPRAPARLPEWLRGGDGDGGARSPG